MQSTQKTNQQPARSHKSSKSNSCRRFDKIDIYIWLLFSWWLGVYIQGHATSAYMVCGRSIIDYDFILRLYLCVYHSLHDHRWCGLVDKHREQVFPKHEFAESIWSANAYYREAHNGLYTRSIRLDGTTWGGTPHVSKDAYITWQLLRHNYAPSCSQDCCSDFSSPP